ncbi:uncharacterized protein CTRU02_203770 [Colletotrichum truncatum]|uniref:Uncharacterized protein n=1 Tax=Colletotrichum truncatum TaxID=5467 RepID=A0ACC3ZA77_COLTU|nr:uncharacterized protein CTRU02_04101 [Colletotrichum truncatum]KAF6796140.1 hypothetical protein CTRU02_04101 [Colletotrichum truncatum]
MSDDLLLLNCHGTCRVNDVTARLAVVVDRVNSSKDKLLLGVREQHEISLRLVGLDASILGNDTGTRARGIEQDTVETAHGLRELTSVVVGDDDVASTQTVNVTDQTLGTLLAGIVGNDHAGVLHHRGHVRRLTTGSGGHIQHTLVLLGLESHDGEERRGSLQDVVAGEVLGSGTQRNVGLEDLKTDLGPLADGLEGNTATDEGLSQITTVSAKGVCSEDNGTGRLVSLEESEGLAGREQVKELLGKVLRVAVVRADILDKLVGVLGARAALFVEFGKVVKNTDVLSDSGSQELQIRSQQALGLDGEIVFFFVIQDVRLVTVNVGLQTHLLEFGLGVRLLIGDLLIEPPCETLDVGLCEQFLAVRVVLVLREHVLSATALLLVRVEDRVIVV